MFKIYADNLLIYDDSFIFEDKIVCNPKLVLEDNSAGSLELTLPSTSSAYKSIKKMSTAITVFKDDVEIWAGRVLSESYDFWNNRSLYCEGELAFLNDSTQPPKQYCNVSIQSFLSSILTVHNLKVSENKRFQLGIVTVDDSKNGLTLSTNFEKTIDIIKDNLIDKFKGHLRIRKENGIRYLDYLAEYPNSNTQIIEFGKNLYDFSSTDDMSDFATVIIPLGSRLEESETEGIDSYTTISSVNGGSIYAELPEAVLEYGWIEKVVKWDDISEPLLLLNTAREYLIKEQFDNLELELKAIDLHYISSEIEDIKLLDNIRVLSPPHGLDRVFPVKKVEIPLDQPENTIFTIGKKKRDSDATSQVVDGFKYSEKTDAELSSRITKTDEAITLEVTRATSEEGNLSAKIEMTADKITSEVSRATNAENTLSSKITQTVNAIRLSVSSVEYNNETTSTISITNGITTISSIKIFGTSAKQAASIAADAVNGIKLEHKQNVLNNQTSSTLTLKNGTATLGTATIDGVTEKQASKIVADAVNGITLSVKNNTNGTSSTLSIKSGSTILSSANITFDGLVTFAHLKDGKTTISGANITTGKISADRIDVSNLHVNTIYAGSTSNIILTTSSNYLYLGGSSNSNTSPTANSIFLRCQDQVNIGNRFGYTGNIIVFDVANRVMYPSTDGYYTNGWKLGTNSKKFVSVYTYNLYANSIGTYNGGTLGFFGHDYSRKQTVSTYSGSVEASVSGIKDRLNDLIRALQSYGLV